MADVGIDDIDLFYIEVGRRVRRARTIAAMTQSDLGNKVGLTRSSVANLEAGRQRIPLHVFIAIANAMETKPETLVPLQTVGRTPTLFDAVSDAVGEHLSEAPATARTFVGNVIAELDHEDRKEG